MRGTARVCIYMSAILASDDSLLTLGSPNEYALARAERLVWAVQALSPRFKEAWFEFSRMRHTGTGDVDVHVDS